MVLCCGGKKHARGGLATGAGWFLVVRAKVDGVEVSTCSSEFAGHIPVDLRENIEREKASGDTSLISDDNNEKTGLIEKCNGRCYPRKKFELFPTGDVALVRSFFVDNAITIEEDGFFHGSVLAPLFRKLFDLHQNGIVNHGLNSGKLIL